jgi:hypothetical protein
MSAESPPDARHRIRRSARLGLIGALLVYACLVLLWLVTQPLFVTGDESAHVDYAFELTQGSIPRVESPMTREFPKLGQAGEHQYVSNHPPAYHALVGPLVWAAEASDHPRAFLLLARAVTAGLGAAVLLTLAATAATVFRRGPRERAVAMIVTVSLAGSLAATASNSASIRNDILTVLTVCATVLVLARAARAGQGPVTVGLVAALCTLGMLTRIAFLPVWLLAIGAVAALELWPRLRRRRPGGAELFRGVLAALVVLVVPLLGAGWFYALSLRRYGDLTGGSAVYPRVADREYVPGAEDGPFAYMLKPSTWWAQTKQLGGAPSSLAGDVSLVHSVLGVAVVGLLLLCIAAATLQVMRRRGVLDVPARWMLIGLVVVAAATYAEMAWHVSHKGVDSQRYLLNGIGLWAIGSAAVLVLMPRRLVPYLATLLAAFLSIGSVSGAVLSLQRRTEPVGGWYQTLVHGAELAGFPAPQLVVALLLTALPVGLALQLVALRRLGMAPSLPDGDWTTPQPSDNWSARGASVGTRTPTVEQRGQQ